RLISSILGARCEVRGARCEVRGARCEVRGARCENILLIIMSNTFIENNQKKSPTRGLSFSVHSIQI
ncbi:hypothetical protein CTM70_08865, partial [Photobacterium phosphoreum]